jgi:fumarylacetoacetate (FAA) hydrolase
MVPAIPITPMKLASFNDGSRDGQLMVVSRDLRHAQFAVGIASRLQQLLTTGISCRPSWRSLPQPEMPARHATRAVRTARVHGAAAAGGTWVDAPPTRTMSLLRRARGAELPSDLQGDPLMVSAAAITSSGPHDETRFGKVAWGIDEAEIAVVTGDLRNRRAQGRRWMGFAC